MNKEDIAKLTETLKKATPEQKKQLMESIQKDHPEVFKEIVEAVEGLSPRPTAVMVMKASEDEKSVTDVIVDGLIVVGVATLSAAAVYTTLRVLCKLFGDEPAPAAE